MTKGDKIILCKENILAVLSLYGLSDVKPQTTQQDRITALTHELFEDQIAYVQKLGYFDEEECFENHGATAEKSWREQVPFGSLQIVKHSTGSWEFDIDICNPRFKKDLRLLVTLIGHGVEVIWPGKTDPRKVRKILKWRGLNFNET